MNLPDYSEWLTPERLAREDELWNANLPTGNGLVASVVAAMCLSRRCKTVLEVGCGAGWVPASLPLWLDYTGFDKNPGCIDLSRRRNAIDPAASDPVEIVLPPTRRFIQGDIREVTLPQVDVACSFSVLKHFGLNEWDHVFTKILRAGKHSAFSMNIADVDKDDGTEFPHSWITHDHLLSAIAAAGHEPTSCRMDWCGNLGLAVLVTTRAKL